MASYPDVIAGQGSLDVSRNADRAKDRGLTNAVPRSLLAILRLHLGAILLITDAGKLFRDQPFSAEMVDFINAMLKRPGWAWYQQFLRADVLPHATLVSYLVMIGELVAGICLLTGTFTRLGAAIAMLLFLNYMFAKGRWFLSPDSEDAAVFFSALVVMLGAAGRRFGVDAFLARRWPHALLW
jgi:uncharacterized membrane protein YphA (DoxX/SURF4 family)